MGVGQLELPRLVLRPRPARRARRRVRAVVVARPLVGDPRAHGSARLVAARSGVARAPLRRGADHRLSLGSGPLRRDVRRHLARPRARPVGLPRGDPVAVRVRRAAADVRHRPGGLRAQGGRDHERARPRQPVRPRRRADRRRNRDARTDGSVVGRRAVQRTAIAGRSGDHWLLRRLLLRQSARCAALGPADRGHSDRTERERAADRDDLLDRALVERRRTAGARRAPWPRATAATTPS